MLKEDVEKVIMNVKKENIVLKDKAIAIIFWFLIFIGIFAFFTVSHPLYIYDTDDWTYIASSRHAWPSVKFWNPTKILPETMMPLTAEMGIRFIMPITNDYIGSLAYAFALFLSFIIVMYLRSLKKMLESFYRTDNQVTWLILLLFVFLHFLPFNNSLTNNKHMFFAGDVTCVYNYVIPGLLNASMVMYMMKCQKFDWNDRSKLIKNSFIVLLVYLCINSNMFHSVILISFIGTKLICELTKKNMIRKDLNERYLIRFVKEYIKRNIFELTIVIMWVVSIIMESRGGRAQWASSRNLFNLPIKETLFNFIESIKCIRQIFWIGVFISIGVSLGIYLSSIRKKERVCYDDIFIKCFCKELLSLSLTWVYLVLLCAKVSPGYIQNSSIMFSWMFWIVLMSASSLAYIVHKRPKIVLAFPVWIFIIVCETVIDGKTYAENNIVAYIDIDVVKQLDENIIRQVVEADRMGKDEVEVLVPVHSSADWPIATSYGGERIANTLLCHGIVHNKIRIKLIPDQSINNMFHLQ